MTSAPTLHPQLPLELGLADTPSFDSFLSPNAEAVHIVHGHAVGASEGLVFVHGGAGVGKTHLLCAAARAAGEVRQRVATIPLRAAGELSPEVLENLATTDLVCIDDVDAVLGDRRWEAALFALYDAREGGGARLLVSARTAPAGLRPRLPDLGSRLSSGVTVRLDPLGETGRRLALQARARQRGFALPDEVLDFLLRRARRDMHSLIGYLDHLDAGSLAEKRRVSVRLVREMLPSLDRARSGASLPEPPAHGEGT
jgi:DnaA-homolog protein